MTEMNRILSVSARAVQVPFRRPPISASGAIPNAALVLIDIDVGEGIVGSSYLFAFSESMLRPTMSCVDALAQIVVGDPLAPLALEAKMRKRLTLLDTPGLVGLALAGIDMAAWDAAAKFNNKPLVELLGGYSRPMRAYNSCGLWINDPDQLADEACELVGEGQFSAVKLRLGRAEFRDDLRAVRNVKQRLGDTAELMVDFNQSLSLNEALLRCRALDDEGLYWIEEPIRHNNYAGYREITAAISTPLQVGENLSNTFEMQTAISMNAGNYYMPDVQRIGGVTGWCRAAALAHASGLEMSSHLFPEICSHLMAVTPTAHWVEYVDWANPILQQPVVVENGSISPSSLPGHGMAWDEAAVDRYLVS